MDKVTLRKTAELRRNQTIGASRALAHVRGQEDAALSACGSSLRPTEAPPSSSNSGRLRCGHQHIDSDVDAEREDPGRKGRATL